MRTLPGSGWASSQASSSGADASDSQGVNDLWKRRSQNSEAAGSRVIAPRKGNILRWLPGRFQGLGVHG